MKSSTKKCFFGLTATMLLVLAGDHINAKSTGWMTGV